MHKQVLLAIIDDIRNKSRSSHITIFIKLPCYTANWKICYLVFLRLTGTNVQYSIICLLSDLVLVFNREIFMTWLVPGNKLMQNKCK